MRISTPMTYAKNLRYINDTNTRVEQTADRYNSGYKFQTARDDPAMMSMKIKYTSEISAYDQYARNAALAADTMAEEETALSSMWTTLNSIHSRLIQAVDGTNNQDSLDAIAADIEQQRDQLYDLMNTQNAEGDYIFAGSNSNQPCMTLNSDGTYVCNANGSVNYVQVAPSVYTQISDTGLNIFQYCDLAHSLYVSAPTSDTIADADLPVLQEFQVNNYDAYNKIYNKYFDPEATSNQLTITVTAATASEKCQYTLKCGNDVLAHGNVESDGTITTDGVLVKFDEDTIKSFLTADEQSGSFELTVDMNRNYDNQTTLNKDNILNQLTKYIEVLRDPTLTAQDRARRLGEAQVTVTNAMNQYDLYRGRVGARELEMDGLLESNEGMSTTKQETLANVTQADAFTTASELVQYQQQLQAARQIFTKVQGQSLFDYI